MLLSYIFIGYTSVIFKPAEHVKDTDVNNESSVDSILVKVRYNYLIVSHVRLIKLSSKE